MRIEVTGKIGMYVEGTNVEPLNTFQSVSACERKEEERGWRYCTEDGIVYSAAIH